MDLTLLLGSLDVLLGALFIVTGVANSRKTLAEGDEYLASFALSMWWYTIGGALLLIGSLGFLDILWRPDFALHITARIFLILLACVGLFCISYYFGYLFLGPNRLWIPVALMYALSAATLVYSTHFQQPIGLDVERANVEIVYDRELPTLGTLERLAVLLFVPPFVGLVGYLSLYRRVPTMLQKWRILVFSALIVILFISPLVTRIIALETEIYILIISRALAVVTTAGLLLTYHPPKLVRERMGDLTT